MLLLEKHICFLLCSCFCSTLIFVAQFVNKTLITWSHDLDEELSLVGSYDPENDIVNSHLRIDGYDSDPESNATSTVPPLIGLLNPPC